VGGGSGVYSETIARRHPNMKVTLFDLEPVCALARERFEKAGISSRVQAVAGDFHSGRLPGGCDCALLAHVLHDWAPAECLNILKAIHDSLAPGGEVLIVEVVPRDDDASPAADLFSLALLLDTKRGRAYTLEEIEDWLKHAGFEAMTHRSMAQGGSLISARRRALPS
jgi:ubiquinone/menaquinone biosynthesis C-methylase UbiE